MTALHYAALGFKAGLEIHQQLDTRKLFCRCPSALDEADAKTDVTFTRALHPTASELGEIDRAAVEEARKSLLFEYSGARHNTCLVEMDEEPPHAITPEALDVALQVALLLKSKPLDEVHVMRKIVVDGSNTSGFQRTALLSTDGVVEAEGGASRIATLCLEEDSARRLDRVDNVQRYRLDRLGIPLVEIATEPDLKGPAHAREVAEAIGLALRATGRVKRGIGTIRQDLNVSIREGARVEIKGVQELRLVPLAIEWEVQRQVHLLDVKKELQLRGASAGDYLRPMIDVSDVFVDSEAKSAKGKAVFAVALPHLAGLLGKKGAGDPPPPRVGRELADYAKVKAGVKGIFHSDELPAARRAGEDQAASGRGETAYGISAGECAEVATRLNLGAKDAYALVVAHRAQADVALRAVLDRAAMLLDGVPEETRNMEPDGTSRYLRPLPGGARMYPETDVPPVTLNATHLASVRARLPELPAQKLSRFAMQYPDLGAEQAKQIVRLGEDARFESLAQWHPALVKEIARLLLNTLPELDAKKVPLGAMPAGYLRALLDALAAGKYAKEAMPRILEAAAPTWDEPVAVAERLGIVAADRSRLASDIDAQIEKSRDLVLRQRERAAGAIMGPLMGKYKGHVGGQELSALVNERLKKWLAEHPA